MNKLAFKKIGQDSSASCSKLRKLFGSLPKLKIMLYVKVGSIVSKFDSDIPIKIMLVSFIMT